MSLTQTTKSYFCLYQRKRWNWKRVGICSRQTNILPGEELGQTARGFPTALKQARRLVACSKTKAEGQSLKSSKSKQYETHPLHQIAVKQMSVRSSCTNCITAGHGLSLPISTRSCLKQRSATLQIPGRCRVEEVQPGSSTCAISWPCSCSSFKALVCSDLCYLFR